MKNTHTQYTLKKISILVSFLVFLSCGDNTDYTYQPDPISDLIVTALSTQEGLVGEEITITGENFSPLKSNNKVFFNETIAEVTAAESTEIKVKIPNVVPAGQGSAIVPVRVSHAGTSFDMGDFTVIKPVTTLVVALTDRDDDVEEVAVDFGEPVGTMDLSSSDLEIGEISSGQGLMNIGLRYNNISIPMGSFISEAYVQFNADNTGSNEVEVTIYGENIADAAPYTETLGDLSARPLTTANVVWNVPEWINKGDRGDAQRTVNIASIVQEIVNRSDWASGNSLNIIIKHTGVSSNASSSSGGREAEDYSSSNEEHGAELTVVYQ